MDVQWLQKQNTSTKMEPVSILRSLMGLFKLPSGMHLTWKTCFLLALASPKKVVELHGLSIHVWHSRAWKSCLFFFVSDFVAKNRNPSIQDPRFEEFLIPSLNDFVDGDDTNCCCASLELLGNTCPEQSSTIWDFQFIFMTKRKRFVSRNTIFCYRPCMRRGNVFVVSVCPFGCNF